MGYDFTDPIPPPPVETVERIVAAAHVLAVTGDKKMAAAVANVSQAELDRYMACSWWPAMKETSDRIGMTNRHRLKAMLAVEAGLDKGDQHTARWAAERLIEEYKPPKQRIEHSGGMSVEVVARAEDRLVEQLARLSPGE
jgi:hypothetical protein